MHVEPQPSQPAKWEDAPMAESDASRYRGVAARLNCLAVDRADFLYVSKECSRHMSRPKNGHWEALKRGLVATCYMCPGWSTPSSGSSGRNISVHILIRIGPDAKRFENLLQGDA